MTTPSTYEESAGRCLYAREWNGYDDSDFSGLFYDPATGAFEWATTASTAWYGGFIPTPNATPEAVAAYESWWNARYEVLKAEADENEQAIPKPGREVRVVGGRKYKGREGVAAWYGEDRYKTSRYGTFYRVGIDPSDGGPRFFVPADYVEVLVGDQWRPAQDTYVSTGLGRPTTLGPESTRSLAAFCWVYPQPSQVRAACERTWATA